MHNIEIDAGSVRVLFGLSVSTNLPSFSDVWKVFVHYCIVEAVSESPYDDQSKVFQVSTGYAIGACGLCRFFAFYCCCCHVGVKGGGGSVKGPIFLSVLSFSLSVALCRCCDMEE